MPHNRFFSDSTLHQDQEIILSPPESRHMVQVMRQNVGDTVEVVNGHGQLAQCHIVKTPKQGAVLKIIELAYETPPTFPVILAQALPRPNRLDTVVEKGTELGMTELWLFPGDRSEKKRVSETQIKRIEHLMISAVKQSGRLYLPKLKIAAPINEWKQQHIATFFGEPSYSAASFQQIWSEKEPGSGAIFVVGPEAGFSEGEVSCLRDIGAQGVCLHPNILRTDTAPLVALSLIQHWRLG